MIKIITDTTVCIQESEAGRMGIRLIPVGYSVDTNEYFESFSDRNGVFEARLEQGARTATVQPSVESCAKHFSEAVKDGGEVLCITISSRLSGIYSSACAAAKLFDGRITVFDSLTTAGGLYLLVKRAYELAAKGCLMGEIVEKLERARGRAKLFFSVGNLSHLRNSRRVGFMRRSVETVLNMKPLLTLSEGTVVFDSMARGDKEIVKRITRGVSPDASEIVINYLGSGTLATYIYNLFNRNMPECAVHLRKFGPVLAVHLGLNILAVSYL